MWQSIKKARCKDVAWCSRQLGSRVSILVTEPQRTGHVLIAQGLYLVILVELVHVETIGWVIFCLFPNYRSIYARISEMLSSL